MQLQMFAVVTELAKKLPIIEDTIIGKGIKYTIFAPSDQAFAKAGKLSDVAIDNMLKYHIIPIETKSTDFIGIHYEQTLVDSPDFVKLAAKTKQKLIINNEGETLTISNGNGNVGKVVGADYVASNGIIQIVDAIIELPKNPMSVMVQRKDINGFGKLITAASLEKLFDGLIGATIFAPSNEALKKVHPELLSSNNLSRLTSIIRHHIVPDRVVFSGELLEGTSDNLKSYERSTIPISKIGKVLLVDKSVVITPDILLNNGNLHVIDELLLPPGIELAPNEFANIHPNNSNNSKKESIPSQDDDNDGSTIIIVSVLGGFVGIFAATAWILIHLKRRQKRRFLKNNLKHTTIDNDSNILCIPSDNRESNYSATTFATQNNNSNEGFGNILTGGFGNNIIHGNTINDGRNSNQGAISPNDDNGNARNYGRNTNQGAIFPNDDNVNARNYGRNTNQGAIFPNNVTSNVRNYGRNSNQGAISLNIDNNIMMRNYNNRGVVSPINDDRNTSRNSRVESSFNTSNPNNNNNHNSILYGNNYTPHYTQ
ncbi:17293_t:CDS:2 [Funneliformis geosporum]|uniref:8264_t:CDS:1 n=1 Tax=Funneliformis geosporum TaxID=1117311 RepID=A0A9W4SSE8_9GLOM|nr:17293_t:CDS:2 [Funneliformis geosporum]CAI2181270.1 8264_t:CDS:2 [Funneliformis geosporum]